ncbi:MAG: hypothetical protein JWM10_3594 [Myxococcaceae bacterium]|nr:hypothetical protein [Myxococcaceae bacterium]
MKSTTASLRSAALLATLCLLGVGCSDDPTPAADSGTVVDVPADLGGDVAADQGAADTGTDVPAADAARDAGTDVPASDVQTSDVPASDVQTSDVQTSDVPASDVPASDGGDVLAARCTATGGTISSGLCCLASGDFPNSCGIGGCSCAPASSHTIQRCTCPTGQCFNPATGCGASAL